jgi:hypothetical protein
MRRQLPSSAVHGEVVSDRFHIYEIAVYQDVAATPALEWSMRQGNEAREDQTCTGLAETLT